MATHDYVIDNQSAPSFRSDLNSALLAVVTQNSNATAPTTTYANMLWYDTANNQIKKRNEANSAWVTLGTVDETAGTFTPSGSGTIASTAEAQAGTNNTNLMTPLRVKEALNASGLAPTYACRAWVNFNGTGTIVIRASGNVSSITDLGVGSYRVNFTTAMPDANFAVLITSASNLIGSTVNAATTSATISTQGTDSADISVAIFR